MEESEAVLERSASQGHVQYVYPNAIPASSLNWKSLKLRHPLFEVSEGPVGKFEDGKSLRPEVCDFLLRQVLLEMEDAARCYSVESSGLVDVVTKELNYRLVTYSMLRVFTRIAPRMNELLEGEKCGGEPHAGMEQVVADMEMVCDGDDGVSVLSEATDLSGWSFYNPVFIHEDGTMLKPKEALEVRGYVSETTLPGNPRLPRFVLEFKGSNTWPVCLPQALYHGCDAAIQNVRLGRFDVVHVLVYGVGWAGVAEIDPVASLEILSGNKISDGALASFKKEVEGKCEFLQIKGGQAGEAEASRLGKMYVEPGVQELRKALLESINRDMVSTAAILNSTAKLETIYKPEPNLACVLLVGEARFQQPAYQLVQFPLGRGAKVKSDDRELVSGMARVVYGDRCLEWTLEMVRKLATSRKMELESKVDKVLGKSENKIK